jgi:hypothetical protein
LPAPSPRIYDDLVTIDARLQKTFGVTRRQLIQIVREVVGARADAVDNDPISAAGLLAYIHGVRNVRALFRALGWQLHRKDNIELVKHPDRPFFVGYQNVDLAARRDYTPKAISGKGPGAQRAIEAELPLFPADEVARLDAAIVDMGMWFFCVSINGDDVRAELSLASGISGGNFEGFIERIFVVRDGEWPGLSAETSGDDAIEFEPVVARKK